MSVFVVVVNSYPFITFDMCFLGFFLAIAQDLNKIFKCSKYYYLDLFVCVPLAHFISTSILTKNIWKYTFLVSQSPFSLKIKQCIGDK